MNATFTVDSRSVLWMILCLITSGLLMLVTAIHSRADTLVLSSLNWPPYSGETLKGGGASVVVARAALNAMGHELKVDYYPWSRTIRVVNREDSIYMGYFPEYYHPTDQFVFSSSMGESPLGIIEYHLFPMQWSRITDLNRYTLGVVRDYVNTLELDEMIDSGRQPVETVSSDEHNIRKVATGRIPGAVMDLYVFNYLVAQPHLVGLGEKLQINKQLIDTKKLYVAFKNSDEGIRWREIYNEGLARIDINQVVDEYLKSL